MTGDPTAIPELIEVSGRDAERLREAIARNYGFVVTLAYAADLIAFIDRMKERAGNAAQKEIDHETE